MSKFALCLGLLAATATGLHAQAPFASKYPVTVDCQPEDDDAIGSRFCMDLRDVVFRSPRYRLVPADSNEPHYKVDVLTMKSQTTSISAALGRVPHRGQGQRNLSESLRTDDRSTEDSRAGGGIIGRPRQHNREVQQKSIEPS